MDRAFLQIQAAFAEMERNAIRQRMRERIAAARLRTQRRPPAPDDARAAALRPAPDGGQEPQRPLETKRPLDYVQELATDDGKRWPMAALRV